MEALKQTREYRMRWWTLVVIAISILIVVLDSTIVNIALPTLQRELGATIAQLQWIITSYIMVFGALMLTTGSLADRFGRARLLQLGIIVFAGGSAAAAFSGSVWQLIIWRAVMGVGGAMILPATLAIITNVFPREERGKAIGVWAGLNGIGIALGPIIGGLIIDSLQWNWIFLINLPIAAVALILGWFLVPNSRDPNPKRLDIPGTLLSIAALGSLVYGLIQGGDVGWGDPVVIATLAGAAVLIFLFILWERHTDHPMLEISFFKNRRFSAGVGAVCLMALAMIGVTFGLTLYMQFVQGYTALETGLRFVPLAVGMLIGASSADRVVSRLGTNRVIVLGFAGTAIADAFAAFWQVDTAFWQLGVIFFAFGFFLGYIAAPATDAVMGALSEAKAGIGSAMNTVSRMVAGSIGVAVIGSVLSTVYSSSFGKALAALPDVPAEIAAAASDSVGAAVTVAPQLPAPLNGLLAEAARQSFMDGWQVMAFVTCGMSIVGAIVILKFMPPHHQDLL
ncbi:MAG: DHA2 family efflux MFS transporter permease subunit [Dehalococcoidia bacterium]|jgi:EmrB/QacA subfamily drug resistance transporter